MTTILLARHGETDWNAEGRFQGHADRPLTERGRAQAESLAARLAATPLAALYASDLRRAVETAEPVAERRRLRIVTRPELREVDVGSWSGLTRAEARARFPDGFRRWRDEGRPGWSDGETYEQMQARIAAALLSIAASHPEGPVLVVGHGGPIRALHAAALGLDVHAHRRLHPAEPNGALSGILVADGRLAGRLDEDEVAETLGPVPAPGGPALGD